MTFAAARMPFDHRVTSLAEAPLLEVPRLPTRVLVSGEGEGRFSMVHHTLEGHTLGVWPHRHTREDEFSFVVEGRLTAKLGDEVVTAGPGELIVKPRMQVHSFWNMHDETCRFLEILSPGGFERCFEEAGSSPMPAGSKAAIRAGCASIAAAYGLEFYFEEADELIARYGLRE